MAGKTKRPLDDIPPDLRRKRLWGCVLVPGILVLIVTAALLYYLYRIGVAYTGK